MKVACSASDLRGLNFEFCVWRAVSSHHTQEVILTQFSLYVHTMGLKPDSFLLIFTLARSSCRNLHTSALFRADTHIAVSSAYKIALASIAVCRFGSFSIVTTRPASIHVNPNVQVKQIKLGYKNT